MRPATLREACSRVRGGEPPEKVFSEFWDVFYAAPSAAARYALLSDEPPPTGSDRLDAYVGAAAEYAAKQYDLPAVPVWVRAPHRYLSQPWFTTASTAPGMIEYLAWASPGEFKSRNIFTDEAPLRRARSITATP